MITSIARRIRVTYVFTHHIRWVPFELTARLIDKSQFDIDYVILGTADPIIQFLKENHLPVVSYPFSDYQNTPEAVRFVYDHLIKNQTDIVQTHWFAGSLIGMQAAYYAKVPVRIFHREHPPLQFYNRHSPSKHKLIWDCATHLIAVTNKSKAGMIEDGVEDHKISVIPTGFDINQFTNIPPNRVSKLREKYLGEERLKQKGPIIGVVARYVKWKGIEFVINAFHRVLLQYPDALLVLAGSHLDRSLILDKIATASKNDIVAPQYDDVLAILDHLDALPKGSYLEIPFEEDLFSLFQLFDIFVHAPTNPIQETFGQVYVEAMLSKVASVVTLSGSALEHAEHRNNAWVVDYQNSDQIADGILALLADHKLRETIVNNAFDCAIKRYDIATHVRALEQFYHSALTSADEPKLC